MGEIYGEKKRAGKRRKMMKSGEKEEWERKREKEERKRKRTRDFRDRVIEVNDSFILELDWKKNLFFLLLFLSISFSLFQLKEFDPCLEIFYLLIILSSLIFFSFFLPSFFFSSLFLSFPSLSSSKLEEKESELEIHDHTIVDKIN